VGIRSKLFLIFLVFGILPMLAVTAFDYVQGARAVEATLRANLSHDAEAFSRAVDSRIEETEVSLQSLANSGALRQYIALSLSPAEMSTVVPASGEVGRHAGFLSQVSGGTGSEVPVSPEILTVLNAFYLRNSKYVLSIMLLDPLRRPLLLAEPAKSVTDRYVEPLRFRTRDFLPSADVSADVWTTESRKPISASISRGIGGSVLHQTVPVFLSEQSKGALRGALIVNIALDVILREVARPGRDQQTERNLIVLDANQNIVYHHNEALLYQPVSKGMPGSFLPISTSMVTGVSGTESFRGSDGTNWLAAYNPVPVLDLSVAALANADDAVRELREQGRLSLLVTVIIGLMTSLFASLAIRKTTAGIKRVTEGAVAVAGGDLEKRIEVSSGDETRLLAESFNRMTDRLREQIAREAETRQFQSFMRLSAMLTHDLKNSIAALSLLVGNMEKRFHQEEFRRDVMISLIESTDKLKGIVAKLSGPVESLSGEHGRPRPTDLVPMLRKAVKAHLDPSSDRCRVEIQLPNSVIASVDAERIEKVMENLVLNAIEAMGSDGGTLTVQAGNEDDKHVFFKIADTGPGMSEEFQRARLFRPFATTKRNGVGLGLYTCREVVKAHGGFIDVESKHNVGTAFRVVLPSGTFHISVEASATRRGDKVPAGSIIS
jgi:signal transduction histidine kinase